MKIQLKALLFKLISLFGIQKWLYSNPSYSQEGEDMILRRFVDEDRSGFYVDVGAHHPYRFSNTYFLHQKGWRGINIDPLPGAMDLFKRCRPKDINLNLGISANHGSLNYFMFNEPALNTFDRDIAESRLSDTYRIIETRSVPVTPLAKVLAENLEQFQQIDLLSVDVEGYDLEVLQSNDWVKFRPRLIVVESLQSSSVLAVIDSAVYQFLADKGYELVAKSYYSCIFLDRKSK